ncbi:MAG TPA: hypothetical protein VHC46_09500 [Thermodesulfobacteriota bacterium]|nr:hypothetical protein [Thermodesulfobacteriota bacterium]
MTENLPDSLRQFADRSRPKELRFMAAQGLVPATPKDLTLILYYLTLDDDADVAGEARKTLNGMPPDVISSVLADAGTQSGILDYFARNLDDDGLLHRIALNTSAADDTVAYLAETTRSQSLIELIANNHERIARSGMIVEALSKNPAVSRSTLDSVIEFLKLYIGRKFPFADSPQAEEPLETETVTSPPSDADAILERVSESFLDDIELDAELVEDTGEEEEEHHAPDVHNQSVMVKISMLNIGQKIKLSIMGNREARSILIKDPNRIVSKAVLKNPRLTDSEIVLISQSKIVNEEILREIADSRKWARLYQVKLALVNNPKTPPHVSINLVRQLRDFDLRSLRWNKNLPGVISTAVKQIVQERKEKK